MAFFALAKTNELADGFMRSVKTPTGTVLLIVHQDVVHIIEDRCPHMDIPLVTGSLEENGAAGLIRCRAHGIAFNLENGEAEGHWQGILPCMKRFEPVYRDYSIGLELPDSDADE